MMRINKLNVLLPLLLFFMIAGIANAKENYYARGIVIQSVEPNKLKVGGREFKTKDNLKR